MLIGLCIIVIVEEWKTNLMSLAILFHFLCAQHVSDINISIIRSLRLFCASACNTDPTPTKPHRNSNTHRTKNNITNVVIQQNSCKLLMMDILMSKTCWSCASACNTDTTPIQPHRNSNTHRTKNNTTNVVIQQNSRKLLMMDILMSETCWAHKKWNKTASDIKLVFYSSTTN